MNPERFARVRGILLGVLALPAERRAARLDEECRGDPELRREIESLLPARRDTAAVLDPRVVLDTLEVLLKGGESG